MFEIKDIIPNKDGSVELEIDYDKAFATKLKKQYGWNRLTKQRLEWFINKVIVDKTLNLETELKGKDGQ